MIIVKKKLLTLTIATMMLGALVLGITATINSEDPPGWGFEQNNRLQSEDPPGWGLAIKNRNI